MAENRSVAPAPLAVVLSLSLACGVRAQAPAGADAAAALGTSAANAQAADRAQKESERTLYWIRVLAARPANKPAAATAPVTRPAPPAARAQPADGARAAAAVAPARGRSAEAAAVQGMARAPDPAAAAEAPPNAAPPLPLGTPPGPSRLPPGIDPTISSPADVAAIAAPALALPLPDLPAAQAPEEPDRGLELAESVDPRFPIALMTRLRKGQVEVRFEVAADGHVESASVERSTHRGLEAAALDAVRQWRFKPGPRGHTALVDLAFDMDS